MPRQNVKNLAVGGDAIKRKNSSPVILQSPKPVPVEDPKEVLANRKLHRDRERVAFREFVKAKRNAGKVRQITEYNKLIVVNDYLCL